MERGKPKDWPVAHPFLETTASLLKSHEILGMPDILLWTRASATSLARPGLRLELDLCEMFMSIPRDRVIPALQHSYLKIIDIPRQNRGPLSFSMSKDGNRKRDCVGSGSREFLFVLTRADIMHFVFLSLAIDVCYVGASRIFRQLTGLPTGGSLSAQSASPFLIANESATPFPSRHPLPSL